MLAPSLATAIVHPHRLRRHRPRALACPPIPSKATASRRATNAAKTRVSIHAFRASSMRTDSLYLSCGLTRLDLPKSKPAPAFRQRCLWRAQPSENFTKVESTASNQGLRGIPPAPLFGGAEKASQPEAAQRREGRRQDAALGWHQACSHQGAMAKRAQGGRQGDAEPGPWGGRSSFSPGCASMAPGSLPSPKLGPVFFKTSERRGPGRLWPPASLPGLFPLSTEGPPVRLQPPAARRMGLPKQRRVKPGLPPCAGAVRPWVARRRGARRHRRPRRVALVLRSRVLELTAVSLPRALGPRSEGSPPSAPRRRRGGGVWAGSGKEANKQPACAGPEAKGEAKGRLGKATAVVQQSLCLPAAREVLAGSPQRAGEVTKAAWLHSTKEVEKKRGGRGGGKHSQSVASMSVGLRQGRVAIRGVVAARL
ncbi:hypothetical protein BC834DRAFT_1034869 [Gloeopeniophorella convolvens]|nr:hypothetical protein BC834DRAFT_1034869 [Gloeopeniophorella convolvens]